MPDNHDLAPEHDDRLWDDKEAAAFLGRSPRTVRRWRRQGKLPTVLDPGGYWRFRAGSLRELVRANEGWLG